MPDRARIQTGPTRVAHGSLLRHDGGADRGDLRAACCRGRSAGPVRGDRRALLAAGRRVAASLPAALSWRLSAVAARARARRARVLRPAAAPDRSRAVGGAVAAAALGAAT